MRKYTVTYELDNEQGERLDRIVLLANEQHKTMRESPASFFQSMMLMDEISNINKRLEFWERMCASNG